MSTLDLDVAGSLASELAPSDFGRIIDSFAEDIARLADEMEAGARAGDRMAIHRAAHGLAGAAAAIGATTLEQAARRGLGREGYPPDLIAMVRQAGIDAMRELRMLVRTDTAA